MKTYIKLYIIIVLSLFCRFDTAYSVEALSLTEETLKSYLAVYDVLTASAPEVAAHLFRKETPPAGSPEAELVEQVVKQAGFASMQDFYAADITIGTAWLQLTAQELVQAAEAKKKEAIETVEEALNDENLPDDKRDKLEAALARLKSEESKADFTSSADFIGTATMDLIYRYRERLQPIMQRNSSDMEPSGRLNFYR